MRSKTGSLVYAVLKRPSTHNPSYRALPWDVGEPRSKAAAASASSSPNACAEPAPTQNAGGSNQVGQKNLKLLLRFFLFSAFL